MQGDHHDIDHEFPEYHETLAQLMAADPSFSELVQRHDQLDDQIRRLEEKMVPIADIEFEKMKFERARLKDEIYQAVRAATANR